MSNIRLLLCIAAALISMGQYISAQSHSPAQIKEYEAELDLLADSAPFNKQTAILTVECAEAADLVEDCIAANAANALNQVEYQKRYDELVARYDIAKARLDDLKCEKQEHVVRKEKIRCFVEILRKATAAPSKFDEHLWRETVETITVYSLENVAVRFCSGTEIRISVVLP